MNRKKIDCVLLIDDDLAGNAFHTIMIRQADICQQVRSASTGFKALDYLAKSHNDPASFPAPDLIFLDINMPGMNGFEFLEEYKTMNGKPQRKTVIVMLTTSSNPDDKERASGYPEIVEYLNKPLTAEVVCSTIDKYFP